MRQGLILWMYRNKIGIAYPLSEHFTIYLLDEIYIDLNKSEYNRNRIYTGIKVKLIKIIKSDISYIWQRKKEVDWHIVALKLGLVF